MIIDDELNIAHRIFYLGGSHFPARRHFLRCVRLFAPDHEPLHASTAHLQSCLLELFRRRIVSRYVDSVIRLGTRLSFESTDTRVPEAFDRLHSAAGSLLYICALPLPLALAAKRFLPQTWPALFFHITCFVPRFFLALKGPAFASNRALDVLCPTQIHCPSTLGGRLLYFWRSSLFGRAGNLLSPRYGMARGRGPRPLRDGLTRTPSSFSARRRDSLLQSLIHLGP